MFAIARFEKVSPAQFTQEGYDTIRLPRRATAGSAGYDFYAPYPFTLAPGQSITIQTGIRAQMEPGWALFILPRSGLGFKFRLQLDNTVGLIDSDYYYAKNEGHIMIRLTNDSREGKTVSIEAGTAFAQGVFLPHGITTDDDAQGQRTGGFGSTGM